MSAPTIPSVADLLRGALAELRRPLDPRTGNGWKQGGYGGPGDSCKCAAGAIYAVVIGREDRDCRPWYEPGPTAVGAFVALATAVGDPDGGEGRVICWNDVLGRTFPEVEAAFERAIELAEAGGSR